MDSQWTEIDYPDSDITGFQQAFLNLLPENSKGLYFKDYKKFGEWRNATNVIGCDENVVFAYLSELSKMFNRPSFLFMYSKLKKMIALKEGVDISGFASVNELVENHSDEGDEIKNLLLLRQDQIEEFIIKAPDNIYLLVKIATMFAMFGSCTRQELHDLCIQDVTTEGSVLTVKMPQRKTKAQQQFTIESNNSINYVALLYKYKALRPLYTKSDNFFVYYNSGKPVGKDTFGKMPRMIANYLKLPDADKYTGHCFTGSAAPILQSETNTNKIESYEANSFQDNTQIDPCFAGPSSLIIPQISEVHSNYTEMEPKRKQATLSIEQKYNILKELETGATGASLAKKYNLGASTISEIKKNKLKIEKLAGDGREMPKKRKTSNETEYPEMERRLHEWYCSQLSENVTISIYKLAEMANRFYSEVYGDDSFVATRKWLAKFKSRFEQNFPTGLRKLKDKISELGVGASQIYVCEESTLFWKTLPEKIDPNETPQERINFFLCSNGDGSHKLKPLVIGLAGLAPVPSDSPKNLLMTTEIFQNWMQNCFVNEAKVFLKTKNLDEKALLLINNAKYFDQNEEKFGGFTVMFVPPDAIQIDRNIIRSTKLAYRKNLLANILSSNETVIAKRMNAVTYKDAIICLVKAWENVDAKMFDFRSEYEEADLPLSVLKSQITASEDDVRLITSMLRKIAGEILTEADVKSWIFEDASLLSSENTLSDDFINRNPSAMETDPLEISEANKLSEQICRTCLDRTSSGTYKSIFTDNIPSIISMISDIELYEGDGLPSTVCDKCFHQLQAIMQFKTRIESSDFNLRKQSIIADIEQVEIKEEYEDTVQIKEEDLTLEEEDYHLTNPIEEIQFPQQEGDNEASPSSGGEQLHHTQPEDDHEQQEERRIQKEESATLQSEYCTSPAAAGYILREYLDQKKPSKRIRLDSENAIDPQLTDPIASSSTIETTSTNTNKISNYKRALAAQRSKNYRLRKRTESHIKSCKD